MKAQEQKLQLVIGTVCDGYAKIPLPEAKVSLLAADSTVVIDSIPLSIKRGDYSIVKKVSFSFNVKKEKRDYLLKASCEGIPIVGKLSK